jgi:hypothetical protein
VGIAVPWDESGCNCHGKLINYCLVANLDLGKIARAQHRENSPGAVKNMKAITNHAVQFPI